ncbi:MAG: hemolysin family protein [Dehalococcoidia bacterium]|jgi:putative hemolysin
MVPSLATGLGASGLSTPLVIVILVVSVALYALVNSIEIAVVAADRIRIRHLAESGDRRAQAIERIRANRDRFFAGIVLLQNLFVVLAAAMASVLSVEAIGNLGLVFGTLITTLLLALLGEFTPKVLAAQSSEGYALLVARPVEALVRVVNPLTAVLAAIPRGFQRLLFGAAPRPTPTVTEAELRMLIDIGTVERVLGEQTGELLENVFQFRDRQVQEIMVPRTEVIWLETDSTVGDFYRVFDETGHSRYPVYRESVDNVVGAVAIKDVLRSVARGELKPDSSIDACMRPTYFVPETKPVGALFREMQTRNQHMAIVVDEYGGTAGIVTIELLLEEMVGPVAEEQAGTAKEFEPIDERTSSVDGGMSVWDANEELDLQIPEGRYETVAGFILDRLGHIPLEGEQIEEDGFRMVVAEVRGRKIERVLVTKK